MPYLEAFWGRFKGYASLRFRIGMFPYRYENLSALYCYIGETEVTDPRDKIYSVLAMLSLEEAALIEPDYNTPCADVYCNAIHTWVCSWRSYNFVERICFGHQDVDGLPSWAVNFMHVNNNRIPVGVDRFGHHSRELTEDGIMFPADDFRTLKIKGLTFDTIEGVFATLTDRLLSPSANSGLSATYVLAEELERCQLRLRSMSPKRTSTMLSHANALARNKHAVWRSGCEVLSTRELLGAASEDTSKAKIFNPS